MARILIVDDERETLEATKFFLDMQGITCWTATNSDEALAALDEHAPDIVLLDVRLQGSRLDGLGILREIKQKGSSARTYMITGYNDAGIHTQAMELGAKGVLEKPLSPDKLMEFLKTLSP